MDWARRRQAIVITVLTTALVLMLAATSFAVFYRVPTCSDHVQNQGETGIDCGGPCSAICSADVAPAKALFARALAPAPGRIDVIAYVENPNSDAAASGVRGTVELYDAQHVLVTKQDATFDLPPASSVPVYLPGAALGDHAITQAFFTIDPASLHWFRVTGRPLLPKVDSIAIQAGAAPRITATLTNLTAQPIEGITLIATVFDPAKNAIAASRTVVTELPPQGTVPLVFTWNQPFAGTAARVEIVPLVSVTAPAP